MALIRWSPVSIGVPQTREKEETLGGLEKAEIQVLRCKPAANFEDPDRSACAMIHAMPF